MTQQEIEITLTLLTQVVKTNVENVSDLTSNLGQVVSTMNQVVSTMNQVVSTMDQVVSNMERLTFAVNRLTEIQIAQSRDIAKVVDWLSQR